MKMKVAIASLLVCLVAIVGIRATLMHEVVINDETQTVTIRTFETDLNQILRNASISLREEDVISPPLDQEIKKDTEVVITRSKPIEIIDGDETKEVYTVETNVGNILSEAAIQIGEYDKVYPRETDKVALDRTIEIVRVDVDYINAKEDIPYTTVYQMTEDLPAGEINVVTPGENGTLDCTYKVVYENGVEVSRQISEENVVVAPKNEVVEEGLDKYLVTSRGLPFRYKEVIVLKATAYDLSYESCGKYPGDPAYGITYTGTHARPGVVAVDPRIVKLGSKLYVESLDGMRDYGFASAEDTGSAIKGKRIDLFIENRRQALNYGVRYVRVYVLDEPIDESMLVGYSQ